MSQTILVIGANSAIAHDAIDRLSSSNRVITAGRKNCDIFIDITQPFDVPKDIDVIVNYAAAFGGSDDEATMDAIHTNELGVMHLCIAAKRAQVKQIVLMSSMSATHQTDSPYYSIYAITKRHGDELTEYYCRQHDIPLTILRPSQIYGENLSLSVHQPFFFSMLAKAAKGEDIHIYGTHDAQRNYLHVKDLSEITARVIEQCITGLYPCLSPENVTYSEIASTAQSIFNMGGNIVFMQDKPNTPDNIFEMDDTIYKKIGYYPQITLKAGIERMRHFEKGKIE